jgi:hypothetical protein
MTKCSANLFCRSAAPLGCTGSACRTLFVRCGDQHEEEGTASHALEFLHFEATGSFSSARIMAKESTVPTKYVCFCVKWRATRHKCRLLCRENCRLSFVFMHIPGGSFIFNISWGSLPPAGLFALRGDACRLLWVPPTAGAAMPSCARLGACRR